MGSFWCWNWYFYRPGRLLGNFETRLSADLSSLYCSFNKTHACTRDDSKSRSCGSNETEQSDIIGLTWSEINSYVYSSSFFSFVCRHLQTCYVFSSTEHRPNQSFHQCLFQTHQPTQLDEKLCGLTRTIPVFHKLLQVHCGEQLCSLCLPCVGTAPRCPHPSHLSFMLHVCVRVSVCVGLCICLWVHREKVGARRWHLYNPGECRPHGWGCPLKCETKYCKVK